MNKLLSTVSAVVITLSISMSAHAEEKKRLPVTEQTVKQKVVFVGNLVNKSQAAKMMENSSDPSAMVSLNKARALVAEAQKKLDAGNFEAADVDINEVVSIMNLSTRRLTLEDVGAEQGTKRYQQRRESVDAILEAYDRVADEKGVTKDGVDRRKKALSYVREAEGLFSGGKIDNAVTMLDKAYSLLTSMTKEVREGDTLVRELKFETPADEFLYEVDRNDSHRVLLKMTIDEKKPHPKFLAKIEELKAEADDLRKKAEELAAGNDHEAAIDQMTASTNLLIKAIRMGGNFIPG